LREDERDDRLRAARGPRQLASRLAQWRGISLGGSVTSLETVAREIDRYFGAAGDMDPAIGTVSIPIRMGAALRRALKELEGSK